MFVDASVMIAIIADEDDRVSLSARLAKANAIFVSPIVVYEAVAGLARKRDCSIVDAEFLVQSFLTETRADIIEISAAVGLEAVRAFNRFGKGRHKADLNMGDCFAYACAYTHQLPLLFKGNDFAHTDIDIA